MENQEELSVDEIQHNATVQNTLSNIIESVILQYILDDADDEEHGNNVDEITATNAWNKANT